MPIVKQHLKDLELPDLPDFKVKEKIPVSKSIEKKELGEIAEKPKSVKNLSEEEVPEKKLKSEPIEKEIKPEHHFILKGGHRIKNMKELKESIKFMDKSTFDHHVKQDKNDFAEWIKNIIKDKDLAEKIKNASNKEHMLNHLEFREKEKQVMNEVKMLETKLKENEKAIAEKDGELRKKQAQIGRLTKDQTIVPEAVIEEKEKALMLKEDEIKTREKILKEKEKELTNKNKELNAFQIKKKDIDEKDSKIATIEKELNELKEKQKNIEKKKEILKKEAELFLKKEEKITERNEFLEKLVNENKKIKDKLLSKEKLLVDQENELRKRTYESLLKENLLEKKEEIEVQTSSLNRIEKPIGYSNKKEELEELKKIKNVNKEGTCFIAKNIGNYTKTSDVNEVKYDDHLLDVLPNDFFISIDGKEIKNLFELADFLRTMSDEVFGYHVTFQKNNFSEWIRDVIKDNELADNVSKSDSKQEMIRLIETRISEIRSRVNLQVKKIQKTNRKIKKEVSNKFNKKRSEKIKSGIIPSNKTKKFVKKTKENQKSSVPKKQETTVKLKVTKKIKKKDHKKIKKLSKDDVYSMIEKIKGYITIGDVSKAKKEILTVKVTYNKLNKEDKEPLKYDILALETDIKLASLNL